jgi:diadenosine tetraphosphate (Ap4A) HIT family hydrolase
MDWESLRKRLAGRCFICELVRRAPGFEHHVIQEDAETIVFLNKYPTLLGYALVAPKAHREGVTADFTEAEYLRLQRVVYRVAEAVCAALPTERIYICSLGSREGNPHVHWHVAPLPPGVPFERQQFKALDNDEILDMSEADFMALAQRIRTELSLVVD